ncbi:putative GCN5-related N-acetyltransferase [uncultured spirochete]|jgi:hypothetical protein|uniref:Putative GCN5-related N-acetyltransferase n=1 Tax=uncultured spirochete TaxID=156406 RepID=A0A3P3XM35_9SPIR|nr:putative GCN5-related N-acetyltransferase [uncultured spirochete]
MKIDLVDVRFEDIKKDIILNITSYSSLIDSYYEDHVIESKHYKISVDNEMYGYLSIFDEKMLTQYRLLERYLPLANKVFEELINKNIFSEIYVSTSDKNLLTVALDYYKTIDVQDYVFQESQINQCDINFVLKKALKEDKELIVENSNNFFKFVDKNIDCGELYIGRYKEELVSFGIIENSKLYKSVASIGIFTIEKERGKNYGAMTIIRLVEECHRIKIEPIAGCFSKNKYSRNAAFKAGMYSNTRLLKIIL